MRVEQRILLGLSLFAAGVSSLAVEKPVNISDSRELFIDNYLISNMKEHKIKTASSNPARDCIFL